MFVRKNGPMKADFGTKNGMIRKRLHGSNYMPNISSQNVTDFNSDFTKLHLTEARTHDQALNNPGQRVVDTVFVFPREDADPSDPANYYFKATDWLFQNLRSCGTQVYYRLGVSIEHSLPEHHFNTEIPKDNLHYAKILAGIIRHYNYGWADGFQMEVPSWEIWNEPDIGCRMWNGTKEQFIRFFCDVLKYLKQEFPNEKIGGPGMCTLRKEWFEPLLAACKEEGIAPDFISWHFYGSDPAALIQETFKAREMLDSFGFAGTGLHVNEWHYLLTWEGLHTNVTEEKFLKAMNGPTGMFGIDSAAFNTALFSGWHDSPLDAAYYYGAGRPAGGGSFGLHTMSRRLNKNYYSLKMFGAIVHEYPVRIAAEGGTETQWILAASDESGKRGALLVTDYRGTGMEIEVEIANLGGAVNWNVTLLDQEHDELDVPARFRDGKLVLKKLSPGSAVFLATFESC